MECEVVGSNPPRLTLTLTLTLTLALSLTLKLVATISSYVAF